MLTNTNKLHSQAGFTLVELMIVIAIIGVLTTIAFPSYQNSIIKTRRADATGALISFANAMERHFTSSGSYKNAAGSQSSPTDTGLPHVFPQFSPIDGADVNSAHYELKISNATNNTYLIIARPINDQLGDDCGIFSLDQTGKKDLIGLKNDLTIETCW